MTFGCGSEECVECYPFTYRCEHGTDFPTPVPNGQPLPDCEEIGCPGDDGDDEDGHCDGDGCGSYLTGYAVMMDDSQIDIEDLEVGDVFEDPAYPGDRWLVNDTAIVDDDVHIDCEKVEE